MTESEAGDGAARNLMPEGQALLDSPARSALREAAASLALAEKFRMPLEMCLALAQVARCYRGLHALQPAEWALQQSYRWALTLGGVDQSLELLCQLAEVSCALAEQHASQDIGLCEAALERTRDRVFEASRLAAQSADPQWEIKVLLRISDLLDRCGDHDDAVGLQARAMRLIYGSSAAAEPAGAAHRAAHC
jgi:hypothetical protein